MLSDRLEDQGIYPHTDWSQGLNQEWMPGEENAHKKYDPQGKYVSEWIPELNLLSDQYLHNPWEVPISVLKSVAVELGQTYPLLIVDHKKARVRALEAFATIQSF